ncbi:hypothetical protein GOB57_21820 [Sinorhizobium meliloti]|nr:hypothetical protein [Sinorhizobium meliloti]
MTPRTEPTYFASRDQQTDVSSFVCVSKVEGGFVFFHNAWGGFQRRAPAEAFAQNFVEVPTAEVERLMNTFEPIRATIGEAEGFMEGWTNGRRWNGWQMPYFTKDAILDAAAEGGYFTAHGMNAVAQFIYLPETNDILEVSSYEGGELEGDVDADRIREIAVSAPDDAEELFQEMGLSVYTVRKAIVMEEGASEPTVIFMVGSGWCWEDMASYDAEPAATQLSP